MMATVPDNMETMDPMSRERRAARRFRMKLPVTVRSFDGVAVSLHGMTHDISESGVLFFISSRPREHAPIEFMVELPSEVTMTDPMRATCKGRVVRVIQDQLSDGFGVAATIEGFTSFIRLSGAPPIFSA
ncbi:MAG TPA: PilZ domain-containing protein [Terriglobales bacterium]|nr:PilZ domain-containing protein [Terriglobales bacterium]